MLVVARPGVCQIALEMHKIQYSYELRYNFRNILRGRKFRVDRKKYV